MATLKHLSRDFLLTHRAADLHDEDMLQRLATWSVVLVMLTVSTVPVLAALSVRASTSDRVAALFPPWWDRDRTFAAAATTGAPIAVAGRGYAILLGVDDPVRRALRATGALMTIDADGFATCLSTRR